MRPEQAKKLTDQIVGGFQMVRQYLNEEAQRAYFEVFLPYEWETVEPLVRETLTEEDQPPTAGWFARKLRAITRTVDVEPRPEPFACTTKQRREAMRKALCDEHGKPINAFAAHVISQWEKTG